MSRRWSWVAPLALLLSAARPAAAQRLVVERTPVVVEYKRFDPAHRPPEMLPGDGAITLSSFECESEVETVIVAQRRGGTRAGAAAGADTRTGAGRRGPGRVAGRVALPDDADEPGCAATVRVTGVRMTLRLTVTVWLPQRAWRKLVDHEEGHRVIAQRVYDEFAEDAARQAARRWIGQVSTGEARTFPAARQSAISNVAAAVGEAYMEATRAWARRVGDRYDTITAHGRRPIGEAEAIEQAFRAEPQVVEEERREDRG